MKTKKHSKEFRQGAMWSVNTIMTTLKEDIQVCKSEMKAQVKLGCYTDAAALKVEIETYEFLVRALADGTFLDEDFLNE